MRRRWLWVFPWMLTVAIWAQEPSVNPADAGKSQDQSDPQFTFKKTAREVDVYFNVKDGHGGLIPRLTKDDFDISEDGQAQTIKHFSLETDQPLTLGILFDTSGSQRRVLEAEKVYGADFLRDVMRPKDMAFLISFDVDVDLLRDMTSSPADIRVAMEKARVNSPGNPVPLPGSQTGPVPTLSGRRGTLLYDAVYLASHDMLAQEVGRKAMILLTDGEDNGSRTRPIEAIEAAQRSDVIAYVILVSDSGAAMGYGEGEMKRLCEQTGGRVIDASNKPEKMRDAFYQIAQELRTQYSIAYSPTNQKRDGAYRKIEIKSKQNYKVQARKGYYAPKSDE
jgi:VWFA-related protein